jgi:hypothetical protein
MSDTNTHFGHVRHQRRAAGPDCEKLRLHEVTLEKKRVWVENAFTMRS